MPARNANPAISRQTYTYGRYVYNTMRVLRRFKRAKTRMETDEKREEQLTSINALPDDGSREMPPLIFLRLGVVVIVSLVPILRRFQRRRQQSDLVVQEVLLEINYGR